MIYYHYSDDVGSHPFPTLAEAVASAEEELSVYRDNAGEGWDDAAGYISVYKTDKPTDKPNRDGLLVAQSMETILEERPDDVDEDGWSESLQDDWVYDFDYLAEYNVVVVDGLARSEEFVAHRERSLAKVISDGLEDEYTVRAFERYLMEANKELDRVKRLTAQLGAEVTADASA